MSFTNAQLPSMIARMKAELSGSIVYHGASCGHCGGTERYVSGRKCTNCAKFESRVTVLLHRATPQKRGKALKEVA